MARRDGTSVPSGGLRAAAAPDFNSVFDTADASAGVRFGAWSRRYLGALVVLDVLVGFVAAVAAASFTWGGFGGTIDVLVVLIAPVCWPLVVAAFRGYDKTTIGVGSDEFRAVFRSSVAAVVTGAFVAGVLHHDLIDYLVIGAPTAFVLSVAGRYIARKWLHQRHAAGRNLRRVILVGSPWSVDQLRGQLARETHFGMRVVGVCVPAHSLQAAHDRGLPVLGDLDHVPAAVAEFGVDAVAVSGGQQTGEQSYLRSLAWALEGAGVELLVSPGLVEVAGPRMHIRPYVGLPLLAVDQPHFTGWRRFAKRTTDVAATSLGLLASSGLMLGIALAIWWHDRGPVFFRQTRVGQDGTTFTMWKFRSMVTDAEARLAELTSSNEGAGPLFKLKEDPRVTPVGRWLRRYSLDELPQLFNVLSGSMSLVGPRPPLESEVAEYATDARRRLLVKPGLTGLWQVSGRSLLSWEETVRLDLRYVENWSLSFDLLILWKTAFAVAARRGAF